VSALLKSSMKFILIVSLILVSLLAYNWSRVAQLYGTITLFDEGVIVENFMNMNKIFPSVEIVSTSSPYFFSSKPVVLPTTYIYKDETHSIDSFLERSQTTALLVLKGDDITHESYYQGTDEADRRISWSVSKSFLSAIFGVAVERGAIKSIEDQVIDYVPELIGSGYENVSIKDVLQMSSGVRFDEDYQNFNSDINRFGRNMALGGSFDDFAKTLVNEREPGTFLHYVSIDTQVLGWVLRKATGETIVDYFNKHLWSEIHPEANTYYVTDGSGEPMVLGGLNMRTRDYAKFGRLYRDNGRWNGKQVIPEEWVKSSVTPDAEHLQPGVRDSSEIDLGYGYQWWLPLNADQEFMALGVYDQFIYVNQKANVVIVKNSTNTRFMENNFESAHETVEVFRAIVESIKAEQVASNSISGK